MHLRTYLLLYTPAANNIYTDDSSHLQHLDPRCPGKVWYDSCRLTAIVQGVWCYYDLNNNYSD